MWTLPETYQTSAGRVAATGFGDGPDLVLAHGWPWSSFSWHRVAGVLAQKFRVHCYDMPGFGASQLSGPRPNDLATQGEVFAEMMDHWGLTRPLVVAHDFGGAITLRAHLLHGVNYAGLILMNVVAMRPWGSDFFAHVGKHIDAFIGLPDHIHAAVVRAYIKGALVNELEPDDLAQLEQPWLGKDGKAAFYAQFAQADERFTAEIEPDFPNVRCKHSILWGTKDPWIPLERGQALADATGVTLQPLEGLGHLPQLEAPDRVAAVLRSELEAM